MSEGEGWSVRHAADILRIDLFPPVVHRRLVLDMAPDLTTEEIAQAKSMLLTQRRINDRAAAEIAVDEAFAAAFT